MHPAKYFFTVISISLLLTAGVTFMVNKGLTRSGVDFYGKMNAVSDTALHADILLVGSSRVLVQLDPHIIDSVTGLNSYNCGLNAGSVRTWYNIIQYALKYQRRAKMMLLNIDYRMFDIGSDPYKDAYYYPYERQVPGFMLNDSGKSKMLHTFKIFDISFYDDYAKYAAIDGLLRPGRAVAGVYKGYVPERKIGSYEKMPGMPAKNDTVAYTEAGFSLLDSCINYCREKKIKLVFVIAPYCKEESPEKYYSNVNWIFARVKTEAEKQSVPYLDFRDMEIAGRKELFYNVNHLNITGAAVYSQVVADSLKIKLQQFE